MEERRHDVVCKKDFKDFVKKNDQEHQDIKGSLDKIMEIYPPLKESVELKSSVNDVVSYSVRVAKVLGILLGVIGTIVGIILGIRQLLK